MEGLTPRQVRALLTFLEGLAAVSDVDALIPYLLVSLQKLIPCEFLSYNEMVPSQRISRNWLNPPELDTPEKDAIWAQHMREHPTLMHQLRTGDGRACTISDFVSPSQLHRLGLYNELYRGWHVEDVLTTAFPVSETSPLTLIGVGFYRDRRTFSERDRHLLNLLRPHIAQTYARVKAHTRLQQELARAKQLLEALDHGLILLSRHGSVSFITPRAQQLLKAYWGMVSGSEGKLPTDLQEWLSCQQGPMRREGSDGLPVPPQPFVVERDGTGLIVRVLRFGDEDQLLVLEEQQSLPSPSSLSPLGLSDRESEVLAWVALGKTDAEIATILGISVRTVGKHLERIYQKLGVENRTAAAMRAISSISRR